MMEVEKGEEEMRSNRYNKKTYDFSGQKYSPELIRKYEDPEYSKAADQYEREARRRKRGSNTSSAGRAVSGGRRGKKKYRLNKLKLFRNILIFVLLLAVFASGVFLFDEKL